MNAPRPGFRQRLWYWTRIMWWGGASKPGPAWLVAYGLAMGFIIGVLFHMNFSDIEVVERVTEKVREVRVYLFGEDKAPNLPRPVTPPPPGMAWVKVLTTGYCGCEICCPGTSDHKTAINRDIRQQPYGIAVEPKIIPYRISLLVPGYGYAMVDDTGGAMRQDAAKGIIHLDLRYAEHQVARRWGRRWMWIAVPADCAAAKMQQDAVAQ